MTRILLIRHGSTDLMGRVLYGRMPGVHINEEGHRQAKLLGDKVAETYKLTGIVSSPLERAVETARPLAEAQRIPIVTDERITEIDAGDWTGTSFEELHTSRDWKDFNRRRSLTSAPGGETMMQVQARAWRSIEERVQSETGGAIALVTHGDVIRCLLLLFLGMPIDFIHRLEVLPGSLTEIELGDVYPVVKRINQTY